LCFATPMVILSSALNLSPLLPLVKAEFGLNNSWAGLLASATLLFHTALQLPGGAIADRIGYRRAIGGGLLLAGSCAMASGLAPNPPLLLLSRFAMGIGTAVAFISGLAYVNAVVPPGKRAMVQGLYGAAVNLGVLLVLLFSERVAAWGSWRWPVVLDGLLMVLIGWMSLVWLRRQTGARGNGGSWSKILRQPTLYLMGIALAITYGVFTALSAWLATFLWQVHGIGLELAGPLAALFPAASMLSRAAGGTLAGGRERKLLLVCCLITGLGTMALPLIPSVPLALLCLLVVGWFLAMPFGIIFSYGSLVSGRPVTAREMSVTNFVGNVGALLLPPMIGYGLDLTGSFTLGFGAMGVMCLAGTAALLLYLPRPRRQPDLLL